MLSYRHIYHAGSPADVLKHAVLVAAIGYVQRKPGAVAFVDTHAGAGRYRLDTKEAEKTGEAAAGIRRVLGTDQPIPDLLAPYLERVRAAMATEPVYPGSATLIAGALRPQDRAVLIELHPTDHRILSAACRPDRRIAVVRGDATKGLSAHLPPRERRGLVFVDPSYELAGDDDAVTAMLADAWRRFPTGVFLLWYPVIERARTDALLEGIAAAGIERVYRIELCTRPDTAGRGMTGSGLVVVNPPFTLPALVEEGLPRLAAILGATGPVASSWLVPETTGAATTGSDQAGTAPEVDRRTM